ncbi:unnamed protein product [Cylicocyclus nassatus]|uniref:Uncharacterized protein n=1 Tax=Cylicocyclus nassatus TaxID=53992 RepID=A0AA36M4X7_CYLNA|nr:unnamed protein product [Cylicocyclus nassatus]
MDYCTTRRLHSTRSRSDHALAQEARIDTLLREMRPNLSTSRPLRVSDDDVSPSPPNYEMIYPPKHAPPPYNQLYLRSSQSTWNMDHGTAPPQSKALSTWSVSPTTVANSQNSSYETNSYASLYPAMPPRQSRPSRRAPPEKIHYLPEAVMSAISLADSSLENGTLTPRNAPRQASFIAAITKQTLSDDEDTTTAMRCCLQEQSTPQVLRRLERDKGVVVVTRQTAKENRRTTIYGDKIFSKQSRHESSSHRDMNHNVSAQNKMRRARPKSYVLATSTSLPETEHPLAISHDDSRELSSLGSLSSIDRTPRGAYAQHAHAHGHRMQKFISLFSHQNSPVKMRAKRSRTSLPISRTPLPDTILRCSKLVRQGWLRHQELALGKTGKRRHWEECYAVLFDRSLYLCPNEPRMTVAENSGEKLVHLPPCARVDVHSSIIDIAYEWLAMSHSKHVFRLVTQTRTEHLFDLNNEADMLSWISTLQSCAEGTMSPQMHSSCSAASLASSSSTPSERNGHTASATNQLIMHRYKAKSSQLQSPQTGKRTTMANDVHCVQPGTSKDSSSGENGEPSTPKSGRKWKKTKAGKQGSGGTMTGGSGSAASSANTNTTSSTTGVAASHGVLGVRLQDCAMAGPDDLVPLVVQICVSVVEANGLDTIGIYRIPGNTAAVNALKEMFAHSLDTMTVENLDLSDSRWRDVNVVSSLLKMFLRKLPEPLLTDKLYPFFIDANRIASHHNRLHKLRNLLRKLPRHHYATLKYIIYHLSEITKNSAVNKMETRNLALMFGPSIVRPSDDNMATMVTHMSDQCKIIETLIHYHEWMFNDNSPADDAVPEQHPSETGGPPLEAPQYGVGVPTGVSAASFNDMHNLIRKANEDQAAAMMAEGKGGKIKNILRRNSRRDKSKSKLKIESTAAAAMNPRSGGATISNHTAASYHPTPPPPITQSPTTQSSVDSAFCGNYQERDIDAEIMSRQAVSPLAAASAGSPEQSPSVESSLGSIPDTSRTDPGTTTTTSTTEAGEIQARRKRQQDIYCARRIFIAGSAAAADDNSAIDALANHTQHLNMANTPALEVLSEETREKIRKMQRRQNWMDPLPFTMPTHVMNTSHIVHPAPSPPVVHAEPPPPSITTDIAKTGSPTKDMTDAVSCTSDYSTTSSAPLTAPLAVACAASSSDYASSFSDPSPCARNASASPRQRPQVLGVLPEARCQQKIRIRSRTTPRDPSRRHTLSDMDVLKEGRLEKFARWFGIRKSSPDVSVERQGIDRSPGHKHPPLEPPLIVRTSPNELTPASGDEQL